jgi:hypothetical protein
VSEWAGAVRRWWVRGDGIANVLICGSLQTADYVSVSSCVLSGLRIWLCGGEFGVWAFIYMSVVASTILRSGP